ncbi:hypothetical protein CKO28_03235 [Rhodovibrio sodomensis]|uniref:Uncharacterized protein n=1 Tax=Rhodovibrio sodomensis TaxID=1088 RepID=A0ABS1DBH5_9PROT|nr:hypothetical protein [Rhodovibrio sodomensis]MBK1667058.1 hypothetical protein [Rhodovibrio sodomensis]
MDDKQRMRRIYRKYARAGLFAFVFAIALGYFVLPTLYGLVTGTGVIEPETLEALLSQSL